jgi:hypothetical protein
MADANPEPGWYLITHTSRLPECWFRRRDGRWSPHRYHAFPTDELPEGWALGSRIDDLLRDATRYRWQPIGTAPKDGSRVRLFIPYLAEAWECEDTGVWKQDEGECGCWRFEGDDGPDDMQPTHWMPLSEPPSLAEIDAEIARDAEVAREKRP